MPICISFISSNPGLHQKHQGVPDGSNSAEARSYSVMENDTLPVTQATGHAASLLPVRCAQNAVTYTRHVDDMCVTHLTGAAVML